LPDIRSFACGDLLVLLACASDGFEDGMAAGAGGDAGVADDETQSAALLNVAKRALN
jgi:hypothetical protein